VTSKPVIAAMPGLHRPSACHLNLLPGPSFWRRCLTDSLYCVASFQAIGKSLILRYNKSSFRLKLESSICDVVQSSSIHG
jgi:hypothetical protein